MGLFRKGPFGSSLTKDMFIPETTPNRIKIYEQKNAIQKNESIGKYYISKEKFDSMTSFIVEPGDIIVSCAGTIGEIYVLPDKAETGVINQALMRIKLFKKSIESYFIMYFDFILKKEANEKGNGTGMKNIPPFDVLKRMLVPLPPENEMNRIISKLEDIISKINQLSLKINSLKTDIEYIKYKILDSFFNENSTYKSYYENCLLQSHTKIIMGQSPKVVLNENIANSIEFHQGKLMFTENEIDYSNKYTINPCKKTNGHSILLCVRAPVGFLNYCNRKIAIGRGLCSVEPLIHVDLDYLYFWLVYLNKYFIDKSTGSTFSAITIGTIKNASFKYCPLEIQHDIKTKIKELFNSLDIIKEQII